MSESNVLNTSPPEHVQAVRRAKKRARKDVMLPAYRHLIAKQRGNDAGFRDWEELMRRLSSQLNTIRPSLSSAVVDSWFQGLDADAVSAGNPIPSAAVMEEAKRIVLGLGAHLPLDTDVYTLEEGKIVVEIFGATGQGFQLICEPGGRALCLITVENASRRARYENSKVLPDGFLIEGLRDVRHRA